MKAKMVAPIRVLLALALLITTLALSSHAAAAAPDKHDPAGAVYVLTNARRATPSPCSIAPAMAP